MLDKYAEELEELIIKNTRWKLPPPPSKKQKPRRRHVPPASPAAPDHDSPMASSHEEDEVAMPSSPSPVEQTRLNEQTPPSLNGECIKDGYPTELLVVTHGIRFPLAARPSS